MNYGFKLYRKIVVFGMLMLSIGYTSTVHPAAEASLVLLQNGLESLYVIRLTPDDRNELDTWVAVLKTILEQTRDSSVVDTSNLELGLVLSTEKELFEVLKSAKLDAIKGRILYALQNVQLDPRVSKYMEMHGADAKADLYENLYEAFVPVLGDDLRKLVDQAGTEIDKLSRSTNWKEPVFFKKEVEAVKTEFGTVMNQSSGSRVNFLRALLTKVGVPEDLIIAKLYLFEKPIFEKKGLNDLILGFIKDANLYWRPRNPE